MTAAAVLLLALALPAGALDLISPLETYEESSGFGFRRDPMGGYRDTFHGGEDLIAPAGTRVRAAAAGVVREVWPPRNGYYRGHPIFGAMVLIEHADGSFTRYGHLSKILTYEGEHVLAGRSIGVIGTTGVSTGIHLHFEHLAAPAIPASVDPVRAEDLYWRRVMMGFANAEQARDGDG